MKDMRSGIAWASKRLQNLENPRLEAEILLAAVLGRDRVFLKKYPQYRLNIFEWARFYQWIRKRWRHVPVAHILGFKNWADLKIFVSKKVLVPRDETEILVHKILESDIGECRPQKVKILDVGTGSGNIAIFCVKKFPKSDVWALDISRSALRLARRNARFHKANIHFLCSDLLQKVPSKSHFDLIIANLPYVPKKLPVSPEVRREPISAIFSGEDGLDHIRAFQKQLYEKKISFHETWLEFFPFQKSEIRKIFMPYRTEFFSDMGGEIFFAKIS